jgi:hypothetical protein
MLCMDWVSFFTITADRRRGRRSLEDQWMQQE